MLRIYGVTTSGNSEPEEIEYFTNKEMTLQRLKELSSEDTDYQLIYLNLDDSTEASAKRPDGSLYEYRTSVALERQRIFDTAMEVEYGSEGLSKEQISEKLMGITHRLDTICKTICIS